MGERRPAVVIDGSVDVTDDGSRRAGEVGDVRRGATGEAPVDDVIDGWGVRLGDRSGDGVIDGVRGDGDVRQRRGTASTAPDGEAPVDGTDGGDVGDATAPLATAEATSAASGRGDRWAAGGDDSDGTGSVRRQRGEIDTDDGSRSRPRRGDLGGAGDGVRR